MTTGRQPPQRSSSSSPAPGPTVVWSPGTAIGLPGPWPRPAMALLGALVCCLLAAWHCRPGLGLPLAPAGGPSPSPAVGESSVPFSSRELPRSGGQSACAEPRKVRAGSSGPGQGSGLRLPLRGAGRARATEGHERQLGSAGRPGLAADSGGRCSSRAVVFALCLQVCFVPGGKEGKTGCLKGKRSWGLGVPHFQRPRICPERRGSCGVSASQQCKFQWDCLFFLRVKFGGLFFPLLQPQRGCSPGAPRSSVYVRTHGAFTLPGRPWAPRGQGRC